MADLSGKTCLVTGGSRGIGRAIALELGRRGASVAVGYANNGDAAEAVCAENAISGGDSFALGFDVADPAAIEPAVASVLERFGKIDVLVNNAGITRDRSLAKMSPAEWDAVLQTNLSSVFHLTSRVLPHMVAAGYGRIVNISSVIGETGNIGQANYSAAKSGLFGLTKTLALETARRGITVNCVAPGFIATDMVMAVPEDALAKVIGHIPVGRLGEPEEVARVVDFLVDPDAGYITGSVVDVNGGLNM